MPKEKRTKLEPFGKNCILVRYSKSSKAFHIYFPGQRYIEVSRDVTFEENIAFKKSKGSLIDIDKEVNDMDIDTNTKIQMESIEPPEPIEHDNPPEPLVPTDGPRDIATSKKMPLWVRSIIQDAYNFGAPSGNFRESKRP